MKLLDLNKCSEASPKFKRHLEAFEEATEQLEKTLKKICEICEQRSALAAKDRTLMSSLIGEFESFTHHDIIVSDEDEPVVQGSVDMIMVTLQQLVDNQDRLFEQINLAIIKPIKHFLQNDMAQVKASKKRYHEALSNAVHLTEKFCQCKRPEMVQMNELSYQLFDARFKMHRLTCDYVLDLNSLHSRKTPDFLQRVVDLMTCMFSHYHVCNVSTKEVNPIVDGLYNTLTRIRSDYTAKDTERRTQVQTLLEQVFLARSQDLLLFLQKDLNTPLETAKSSVMQHLAANYGSVSYVPSTLSLPEAKQATTRSKSGYLMYLEQRTFGNTWVRLYFTVKRGCLEAPENKAKVPISLQLNVCSVKLAEPSDSERNFCFKVISPFRTILLQAEDSKVLQEWTDVLTNAITHAIHNQTPSSNDDTFGDDTASSPSLEPSSFELDKPRSGASIMRQLQSIAGNEICADCEAAKPKWASINLGVLICIECSGVHRSLGVHVSQVRSLTLDTMKPEWEEKLKAIGNKKSNSVYEALLPSGFSRNSLKNDQSRTQFIQDKYIHMKYTSEENKEYIRAQRDKSRTASLAKSKEAIAAAMSAPHELGQDSSPAIPKSQAPSSPVVITGDDSPPTPTPVSPSPTPPAGGKSPRTSSKSNGESKGSGSGLLEKKKQAFGRTNSSSSSASFTGSGSDGERPPSRGGGAGGGTVGGMFQKMGKSLESVKDSVVKFAKNE